MKITNLAPNKRYIYIKISGYYYKIFINAYSSIDVPEVTDESQVVLNPKSDRLTLVE